MNGDKNPYFPKFKKEGDEEFETPQPGSLKEETKKEMKKQEEEQV